MIWEYRTELYEPAHAAYTGIARDNFAAAGEHAVWNREVANRWPGVRFLNASFGENAGEILAGSSIPLRAGLDLAGLSPKDVRVEALVGRVGPGGELEDTEVLTLPYVSEQAGQVMFGTEFVPLVTGRLGYSVRVSPNHGVDPLSRPCHAAVKWMENGG